MLALHGFTLGGAMFAELAGLLPSALVAPDLPGHGGRNAASTSWHDAVGEVVDLARDTRPATVLGYSMGGRLALAAALRAPRWFSRLVLVSTSLGIADTSARAERLRADRDRASRIEATGSALDFIEEFAATPFLQAPTARIDLMAIRLANRADGIAGALRGMGQGSQPYLEPQLGRLDMPMVWVAGSRDDKYATMAQRAAAACGKGSSVIVDAAHNVVAEQPAAIAAILMQR